MGLDPVGVAVCGREVAIKVKQAVSTPVGTSGCAHWFDFSKSIVEIACSNTVGGGLLLGESGTVVPLFTSAAFAPRRPSHALSFPRH